MYSTDQQLADKKIREIFFDDYPNKLTELDREFTKNKKKVIHNMKKLINIPNIADSALEEVIESILIEEIEE